MFLARKSVSTNHLARFTATATDFAIVVELPGSHTITATYEGNATYAESTASIIQEVVPKLIPAVTVISTKNPIYWGESVSFRATIAGPTNEPIPTGTVDFYDGTTKLGAKPVVNGSSTLVIGIYGLSTTNHAISVRYLGDTIYTWGQSSRLFQDVILKPTPTISLTSNKNPSFTDSAVTFTATVAGPNGSVAPTGSVEFYDGTTKLGTRTLLNGTAAYKTTSTQLATLGTHNITIKYLGDADYGTKTSTTLSQVVVAKPVPTILLISSQNPSVVTGRVTFTAIVSRPLFGATPIGNVAFYNGTTLFATNGLITDRAFYTTPSTLFGVGGTYSITARYVGGANFGPITSTALVQIVTTNSITPDSPPAPTTSASVVPGELEVSWFDFHDINNPYILYGVECVSSTGGVPVSASVPRYESSAQVVGASFGEEYTCTLTVSTLDGTSGPSEPSNAVIVGTPTPPEVPVTPVAASRSAGTITVTWVAPWDGGSPITQSHVICTSPTGDTTVYGNAYGEIEMAITFTGATSGKSYTCTVNATNQFGTSPMSTPSNPVTEI